jgi:hypothetical protein
MPFKTYFSLHKASFFSLPIFLYFEQRIKQQKKYNTFQDVKNIGHFYFFFFIFFIKIKMFRVYKNYHNI